jgi:hypothetical protein
MKYMIPAFTLLTTVLFPSMNWADTMSFTVDLHGSSLVFGSNSAYPGFDVVRLDYEGHGVSSSEATEYGAPLLPLLSVWVVLPQSARVTDVAVIPTDAESVAGSFRIMPAQQPVSAGYASRDSDATTVPKFIPPIPEIYDSPNPYPSSLLNQWGNARADYNEAWVTTWCMQYIPSEGKLVFYRQLKLVFTLEADTLYHSDRSKPGEATRKREEMYVREEVINPEDAARFGP